MQKSSKKCINSSRGQGMTEYIIIVALIAIASIGVMTVFGNNIRAVFGGAADAFAGETQGENRAKRSSSVLEHHDLGNYAKNHRSP